MASFAVAVVALVGVVLALGNLALWLYAQNVVTAAAQEAAVVASREDGTVQEGQQRARGVLVASLGPGAEHVTRIDIRIDANAATVNVQGVWPVVLLGPAASAPLHATATIERERFRPGGN
jgi:uncharacterized membrane protein YqiK